MRERKGKECGNFPPFFVSFFTIDRMRALIGTAKRRKTMRERVKLNISLSPGPCIIGKMRTALNAKTIWCYFLSKTQTAELVSILVLNFESAWEQIRNHEWMHNKRPDCRARSWALSALFSIITSSWIELRRKTSPFLSNLCPGRVNHSVLGRRKKRKPF